MKDKKRRSWWILFLLPWLWVLGISGSVMGRQNKKDQVVLQTIWDIPKLVSAVHERSFESRKQLESCLIILFLTILFLIICTTSWSCPPWCVSVQSIQNVNSVGGPVSEKTYWYILIRRLFLSRVSRSFYWPPTSSCSSWPPRSSSQGYPTRGTTTIDGGRLVVIRQNISYFWYIYLFYL